MLLHISNKIIYYNVHTICGVWDETDNHFDTCLMPLTVKGTQIQVQRVRIRSSRLVYREIIFVIS